MISIARTNNVSTRLTTSQLPARLIVDVTSLLPNSQASAWLRDDTLATDA